MSQQVLIEFYDTQNNKIRDKLHVPLSITRKHLLSLLNQPTPSNLYLNDQEIRTTLQDVTDSQKICLEQILKIKILPSTDTLPIQTTHCSSSYSGHESPVLCIKYSTCGAYIYSGGGDCTLRVWHALTKTQVKVNKHHTHWVLCIDCSIYTVVSGDMSGTICTYTVTGDFIHTHQIHKNAITALILHHDRIYTSSRDKTVKISTLTGTILYSYTHTQPVTCIALNTYFFISGSTDKSLKIYTHHFKHLKTLTNHKNRINCIFLNNKFILTTSDDHTAHLYHIEGLENTNFEKLDNKLENNLDGNKEGVNDKEVEEGVINSTNKQHSDINEFGEQQGDIKESNTSTNKQQGVNNLSNNTTNKQHPLNNSIDKQQGVSNLSNNTTNKQHPLNNSIDKQQGVNNLSNNTTNKQHPLNNSIDKQQGVNNLSNNTTNKQHPLNNSIDKQQGVNNLSNNTTNKQHPLITIPSSFITLNHNSIITTASISPNNTIIATGSFDKKVKIWNTTGTLISEYLHLNSIYKVHCTNTSIISASKDGIIKIYSYYNKSIVNEFICKNEIYCFDIYNSQLVCGCKDKKGRVFRERSDRIRDTNTYHPVNNNTILIPITLLIRILVNNTS
ncbi:hypothetical protein CWI38_0312p0060 [Hamiltosporidium tvaerminnensis]|uniref:TEP-1 C-terminal beta-propeller domain-containing protein n=1 Tax=Hamiltosporidium tvaerminnensis TaxID=1176355 RepID=A0A4Q9LYG0_9MICR|nr:hypothetical protein CWI38_0312p0060 [Hamiltosporidium tvaerminnensis]